jgi:nucleoid-associated protein YgaU
MSIYQIQQLFVKELKNRIPQLVLGSFIVYFLSTLVLGNVFKTIYTSNFTAPSITAGTNPWINAQAPEAKPIVLAAEANTYTVGVGDTLWSIAEKTLKSGFKYTELVKINKISNPGLLAVGQKLTIPVSTVVKGDLLPEAAFSDSSVTSINSGITYTVVAGDNLYEIAERLLQNGDNWTQIAKANSITTPSLITPGQLLTIPPPTL